MIVLGTSAGGLEALDQLVGQLPTDLPASLFIVQHNCPGCGGVLWEMDTPGEKRYRCHTGHSYTGPALLASQSEKIEEMLWISLRMFEERKNLLTSMAKASRGSAARNENRRRAKETQGYIDRIRGMLLEPGSGSHEDTLTHVKGLMAEPRQARSTREKNGVERRSADPTLRGAATGIQAIKGL